MYFTQSMTQDDAKKLFRKLALELHPDKATEENKGAAHLAFIKLKNEYEQFLKGNFCYSSQQASEETDSFDEFIKTNHFIKNFEGVIVEIVGTWIYLSDNTYPYKEQIKENGFRFSGSKKRWYKAPHELKKSKVRGSSFDKITEKYGVKSTIIGEKYAKIS